MLIGKHNYIGICSLIYVYWLKCWTHYENLFRLVVCRFCRNSCCSPWSWMYRFTTEISFISISIKIACWGAFQMFKWSAGYSWQVEKLRNGSELQWITYYHLYPVLKVANVRENRSSCFKQFWIETVNCVMLIMSLLCVDRLKLMSEFLTDA